MAPEFTVVTAAGPGYTGPTPPGSARVLDVTDTPSAEAAVLVALAGHDLVVRCSATEEVVDGLVEDLARLGTVRVVEGEQSAHADVLPDDHVALLARLHQGMTLGAAAADLHLSRRTADRRLARARSLLGVSSTPEALVAAARRGLLG